MDEQKTTASELAEPLEHWCLLNHDLVEHERRLEDANADTSLLSLKK